MFYLAGIFLKQKPFGDMFVALYSGFMYKVPEQTALDTANCAMNETKTAEERRHCTKYSLSIAYVHTLLGIPWERDQPGSFQPTLGQKVLTQ